jgi:hypothetical protein
MRKSQGGLRSGTHDGDVVWGKLDLTEVVPWVMGGEERACG